MSDMNFANPKIKVPDDRMRELATAIAAQVPGGNGLPTPMARPMPAPPPRPPPTPTALHPGPAAKRPRG
ncbi:MAG: hypothetical protein WKG07_35080 [Hymenobacter sp.]